jgi:hypothetical protein
MKCFIVIHGIMNVKRLLPWPLKRSKLFGFTLVAQVT